MKKQIIMASGNKGKIKEAQEILKEYKIIPMSEIGIDIDVEEDQDTFEGNAIKKAETIAKNLRGKMCIADDSGIEIEYLDGFPGVYTKRWHQGTDRERNLAILEKMKGVPKEKRKINFVTAIALSDGKNTICKKGILSGYVAENVRGKNGFGFDEIFELEKHRSQVKEMQMMQYAQQYVQLQQIEEQISKQSLEIESLRSEASDARKDVRRIKNKLL